jgi:adenine deaminase
MTQLIGATGPHFDDAAWRRRLAVAQRREPADLVITGGRIVNVFSGELVEANIAVVDGVIAGVGEYTDGLELRDATGQIVAPSFIDAHIHIESTHLWPSEFARAVLPHGTGAVVADAHEIANVCGLDGLNAIRAAAAGLPLHIRWTIPSCVPASPAESSGAVLLADELTAPLAWPESGALGELMNVPGLLSGDGEIGRKLGHSAGMVRDGHAPGVRGAALQAYAGSGISSDHESTTAAEALEKLRAGMMVVIRQGSSEHNLRELLPIVNERTASRCAFGSDDRDCHDLLHRGHMDDILRLAVAEGLDPILAIRMATLNPAQHWRLPGIGAIAPGYEANLVLLDNLTDLHVTTTWFQGRLVAEQGRCTIALPLGEIPAGLLHTMRPGPVMLRELQLPVDAARQAIGVIPGQIVTRLIEVEPAVLNGVAVADPARDLLKIACVERHQATGRVGVGYITGLGLKRGAVAGSIAHDAHNIIAAGASDTDMLAAIATVADLGGGLAVVAGGEVLAHLPLPIAGLLSDQPAEAVAEGYAAVENAARSLGSTLSSPFGTLAFMGLSVIPEARITDRGFLRVG